MRTGDFRATAVVSLAALGLTLLVAWIYDLPVRDPDNYVVPTYVRLPLILLLAVALDILPRAAWRSRRAPRALGRTVLAVVRERWTRRDVRFAVLGLVTWYVAYLSYRNLKSYVPFVNSHLWDAWLRDFDRTLFLGHDPGVLLHDLLGRDLAAHALSYVYLSWVVVVPFTLAIALVWSRNRRVGEWYVTAVALDWVLGALTYLTLPALGPVYADPEAYAGLAETDVSRLQATMMTERSEVLLNPFTAPNVQMIAAFTSLHVAICVTVCVFAELRRLRRSVRVLAWAYLALTALSTIYLGWHYTLDLVGGAALGVGAAWLAARATGQPWRRRPVPDAQAESSEARSLTA